MPPKRDNSDSNNNSNKTYATESSTSTQADNNHHSNNSHYDSTTTDQADQRHQLYEANAKLCDQVKKCPWMFDRAHPNYNKKKILDKSWSKIAKECNDSVASCKDRWRNIRAAFARSVNLYKTHSGPNRVKPYYLANELQFLVKPMTENRNRLDIEYENTKEDSDDDDEDDTNGSTDDLADGDKDEDAEEEDDEEENERSEENAERRTHTDESLPNGSYPLLEVLYTLPARQQLTHAELSLRPELPRTNINSNNNNNGTYQHLQHENEEAAMVLSKRRCVSCSTIKLSPPSHNDADLQFLLALLPDMQKMNARQKIVFKSKVYQSIEEVFINVADFPHCAATVAPFQSSSSLSSSDSLKEVIVNNVTNMNPNDLQNLNAYMQQQQQQQQQLAANRRGNEPLATTIIPHPSAVTPTTTTTTLTNGRASNRNSNQSNNKNNLVWHQLLPIAIKDEVNDDVDDVDVD